MSAATEGLGFTTVWREWKRLESYALVCLSQNFQICNYLAITDLTCENGTVHLVGGDDVSRGRVQYCYEGTWYSVCASGWEDNGDEARVICSTLGYDILTHRKISTYLLKCVWQSLFRESCDKLWSWY